MFGFTPESRSDSIGFRNAIVVDEEDAVKFACNAVSMGDKVILNSVSDALRKQLAQTGLQAAQAPLSEFLRAGGASKCLTLRLEDPVLS